tara:strand:- start:377 stop:625 length:249 start_codon:yes stop_codon:yes gene_type:complete
MIVIKIILIIYAIFFYIDLIQDQKWVFGWGEGFTVINNFSKWIENYKIFGLKIEPIFYIPMIPVIWMYAMHPILLISYFFAL